MGKRIKVGIAEDHDLVREGLISLIKEEHSIKIVFEVANGLELLEVLKIQKVDVILLDIEMPIVDGIQALRLINERFNNLRVIMLSMHYTNEFISKAISLGARGFLPKNCSFDKLVDAIFAVNEQGYYFDNKVSRALINKLIKSNEVQPIFTSIQLTAREVQVLELLCNGKLNKEIADLLCISVRTVETHRRSLGDKTNSRNLAGLIMYAIKNDIIDVD